MRLKSDFLRMCRTAIPHVPGNRPYLLHFILRKPNDYGEFISNYYEKFSPSLSSLVTNCHLQLHQVFEIIKNAAAHGGDALVVARRYRAYRQGSLRTILEFIIWDNGPGIQDIRQAVIPGFTTCPGRPYDDLRGQGKGLDGLIAYRPTKYIAHEIIIESGSQKVYRRHQTDSHQIGRARPPVPGTKVTLRFWL
jgi:hypothetical protein